MQIIHRDDIEIWVIDNKYESTWYVDREVSKGSMQYIDRYDSPSGSGLNPVYIRLDNMWQRILRILDYETSGKRILDLGCGAEKGNIESRHFEYTYKPWLGRFLHATSDKTGIDYVGVDIGDLSSEKFKNIQMSLLEENCLINNFTENQFDIVIAQMLFNSPELEKQINNIEEMKDASQESALKLKVNLLPQIERILKPEWVFLWQGGNRELFSEDKR